MNNVSIELEFFYGRSIKKTFEEVEGEASFPFSFDGLKAGEYKVKATFEYVAESIPKRAKKELTIYVKGSEVKHVKRSVEPEDLLGV